MDWLVRLTFCLALAHSSLPVLQPCYTDFGIDSPEGQASWQHLNRIHGIFRNTTNNRDFVYVLCCFIVDTIRFIDVFGWRALTPIERQGTDYHDQCATAAPILITGQKPSTTSG